MERRLVAGGYLRVAGVDEAGRGPLAGPVVAAAVVLDLDRPVDGVADSKTLAPAIRERVFWKILAGARDVTVGTASAAEIDRDNILRASLAAMARAVMDLSPPPDHVLVDGPFRIPLAIPQTPLVRGDSRSPSIGAASIVAKVLRDRLMAAYDRIYPDYGFAAHKGYGTATHRRALQQLGPCPIHRCSFRGVR